MKIYRISISGDKWSSDFTVQASGWSTAISRAVREWQKKNKGSRTEKLSIKAVKSGSLLQEKDDGTH